MKVLNYVLLDNNNILEISSPNNLNSDDLEYFSQHMTKTSDNILDLVEVGDLVNTEWGIVEIVEKYDNNQWVVSMNETVSNIDIKAIYKKQSNGDYKRYSITD